MYTMFKDIVCINARSAIWETLQLTRKSDIKHDQLAVCKLRQERLSAAAPGLQLKQPSGSTTYAVCQSDWFHHRLSFCTVHNTICH